MGLAIYIPTGLAVWFISGCLNRVMCVRLFPRDECVDVDFLTMLGPVATALLSIAALFMGWTFACRWCVRKLCTTAKKEDR